MKIIRTFSYLEKRSDYLFYSSKVNHKTKSNKYKTICITKSVLQMVLFFIQLQFSMKIYDQQS